MVLEVDEVKAILLALHETKNIKLNGSIEKFLRDNDIKITELDNNMPIISIEKL